jgi:cytoskeletal protein CcmA (bactofilin family)
MKKLWQSEQPKADRTQRKADPVMKTPEKPAGPKAAAPVEQPQQAKSSQPVETAKIEKPTINAPEAQSVSTPARSFVGSKMSVKGELEATEDLLVAGYLEGTVSLPKHTLTVAGGGRVKATVTAHSVIVEGEIDGDLDCTESVVLKPSSRVTGNILMRRINIMDGAVFNGKVTMRSPEK